MQSITKIKLSEEVVEQLLRHHVSSEVRLRQMLPLEEGFYNTAYRLDLADGRVWVLKVAPPTDVPVLQYEADIMSAEVSVMRLLRARTSVPVPEIHLHQTASPVIDNEFYLMDFVDGPSLHQVRKQLAPEQRHEIDRQLGGYLREVNAITGPAFGYYAPCQPRFERWRTAFDWMVQRVLEDGQRLDVALSLPYEEVYRRMAAQFALLDEVTIPSLVLWDVWDGNVFVDAEAKAITGIIDFERALWADPLMEMSFGLYDPDSGFAEGYGRPVLETSAEQGSRTLYNIYLFLIMVIETYYRRYPTNGQETWARRKLTEELAKLPE